MPELPEVETVRRSLERRLPTHTIVSVTIRERRLRYPVDATALGRLVGMQVVAIRRRAKYLLIDLAPPTAPDNLSNRNALNHDAIGSRQVLLVHLGMTGRLRLLDASEPAALDQHDHAIFDLNDGLQLRFHDPRRFGWLDAFPATDEPQHPRLTKLGIEPLSKPFTGAWLHQHTRGSRKPIKNFIMDGTHVVGIGNIYACEALHAAQIHPNTAAERLSAARCTRLVEALQQTLLRAVTQGGTTLRNFVDADGAAGYFSLALQVYGRENMACPRCRKPIRRTRHAGRSTFFCPSCQH